MGQKMQKTVTLKDIAKECGFSLTQVSRALNDYADVNNDTKKIIRETARRMGYVKNIAAHNLATKNSNQIAFIVSGIDKDSSAAGSTFVFKLMQGVQKYCGEIGFNAAIYLLNKEHPSYVDFCRQHGINGVIIFGANYDDNGFNELIQSDIACVAIDISLESDNKGCVMTNDSYYSQLVVSKLIELGHKNIALINGHSHAYVSLQRLVGYQLAHLQHGFKINESYIINGKFDTQIAYERAKQLIDEHPMIDAIFCISDSMAIGCLNALRERGYSIPDDISVVGFDGIPAGEYTIPKLATVIQDPYSKGYLSAKLLMSIINKTGSERTIFVPCVVDLKGSVRRPKDKDM